MTYEVPQVVDKLKARQAVLQEAEMLHLTMIKVGDHA